MARTFDEALEVALSGRGQESAAGVDFDTALDRALNGKTAAPATPQSQEPTNDRLNRVGPEDAPRAPAPVPVTERLGLDLERWTRRGPSGERGVLGAIIPALGRAGAQMETGLGGALEIAANVPFSGAGHLAKGLELATGTNPLRAAGRALRERGNRQAQMEGVRASRSVEEGTSGALKMVWERGLETAPQLAGQVALGAATGGLSAPAQFAAFAAPSFVLEGGGAFDEAVRKNRAEGLDEDRAEGLATLQGLATGTGATAIEVLPFAGLFGKVPGVGRFMRRQATRVLGRGGRKAAGQAFETIPGRVAAGFAGEGSEEAIQELWGDTVDYAIRRDPTVFDDLGRRMWDSFLVGGAAGGVFGGVLGAADRQGRKPAEIRPAGPDPLDSLRRLYETAGIENADELIGRASQDLRAAPDDAARAGILNQHLERAQYEILRRSGLTHDQATEVQGLADPAARSALARRYTGEAAALRQIEADYGAAERKLERREGDRTVRLWQAEDGTWLAHRTGDPYPWPAPPEIARAADIETGGPGDMAGESVEIDRGAGKMPVRAWRAGEDLWFSVGDGAPVRARERQARAIERMLAEREERAPGLRVDLIGQAPLPTPAQQARIDQIRAERGQEWIEYERALGSPRAALEAWEADELAEQEMEAAGQLAEERELARAEAIEQQIAERRVRRFTPGGREIGAQPEPDFYPDVPLAATQRLGEPRRGLMVPAGPRPSRISVPTRTGLQEVETRPTEGQKEAGNYKKAHVRIDGLDVSIENPAGSVRRGTDKSGRAWEQAVVADYGYIRGTKGRDGDQVDVFIRPNSAPEDGPVWIVNQQDPETGEFDEHKAMLGYASEDEARAAYLGNYEPGWQGLGSMARMEWAEFKAWARSGRKRAPALPGRIPVRGEESKTRDEGRGTREEEGLDAGPAAAQHGITEDAQDEQGNAATAIAPRERKRSGRGRHVGHAREATDTRSDSEGAGRTESAAAGEIQPASVGRAAQTKSPDNQRIYPGRYVVVALDELTVSHDANDQPDPAYQIPGAQNRAGVRQRALESIIPRFDPEQLLFDSPTSDGPMGIDTRGQVIYGNARGWALREMAAQGDERLNDYVRALTERAEAFGVDPAAIQGLAADGRLPVLVKEHDLAGLDEAAIRQMGADMFEGGRFSARKSERPVLWYSKMREAIERASLPKKAGPATYRAQIQNLAKKGLFKQAELDESGLIEWLDEQQGEMTREDVLAELDARAVDVREVTMGANQPNVTEAMLEAEERNAQRTGNWERFDEMTRIYEDQQLGSNANESGNETKFAQYQLPGGENYRELLLTLPEQRVFDTYSARELDGEWVAVNDRTDMVMYPRYKDRQKAEEYAAELTSDQKKGGGRSVGNYQSSHFDTPNILAHVRFNERTDADGKRVLFIEEIQSDWHQAGRKRGYKQGNQQRTKAALDAYLQQLANARGMAVPERGAAYAEFRRSLTLDEVSELNRLNREHNNAVDEEAGGVPDAPFKKNWHELAMKRMLRWAVDNGFDRVAWTTGAQQVERYDNATRQRVDSIKWAKWFDPDTVRIRATRNGADVFQAEVPLNGTTNVHGEQASLDDLVGKNLADQIRQSGPNADGQYEGEFQGDDLTIGGEGMKGFYDKILPSFVNSYAKKWGVRVGQNRVSLATGFNPAETAVVHSLDITPAMREALASGPQPQYSRREAVPTSAARAADVRAVTTELERIAQRATGGPGMVIAPTPADLPANVVADAESRGMRADDIEAYFGRDDQGRPQMIYVASVLAEEAAYLGLPAQVYAAGKWGHEAGIHYGLEGLLGAEGKQAFLDQVVRTVGLYRIRRDLPQGYEGLDKLGQAEEYLARLAERIFQGEALPGEAGIWRKLADWLRTQLRRITGIPIRLSDGEIARVVRDSVRFAETGERGAGSLAVAGAFSVRKKAALPPFGRQAQINSQAFKKWFGDSEVVDEDGEPQVVYHWTTENFSEFAPKNGMIWFSDDPSVFDPGADTFSPSRVMPVYLSIQAPLNVSQASLKYTPEEWREIFREAGMENADDIRFDSGLDPDEEVTFGYLFPNSDNNLNNDSNLIQAIKDSGYDGIHAPTEVDMMGSDTTWVAFYPTQIKSATANVGTFDATNPDIRYSARPRRGKPTPPLTLDQLNDDVMARIRELRELQAGMAEAQEKMQARLARARQAGYRQGAEATRKKAGETVDTMAAKEAERRGEAAPKKREKPPKTITSVIHEAFRMGERAGREKGMTRAAEDLIDQSFRRIEREYEPSGNYTRWESALRRVEDELDGLDLALEQAETDEARAELAQRALRKMFGPQRYLEIRRATRGDVLETLKYLRGKLTEHEKRLYGKALRYIVQRNRAQDLYNDKRRPGFDFADQWRRLTERFREADSLAQRLKQARDYLKEMKKRGPTPSEVKAQETRIQELQAALEEVFGNMPVKEARALYEQLQGILAGSNLMQEVVIQRLRTTRAELSGRIGEEVARAHEEIPTAGERTPVRRGMARNLVVDARGSLESWAMGIGGGRTDTNAYGALYENVRDGESLSATAQADAHKALTRKLEELGFTEDEIRDLQTDEKVYTLAGYDHRFTRAQLMSLYLHMLDAEAVGKLYRNGFKGEQKRGLNKLGEDVIANLTEELTTEKLAERLTGKLTEREKSLARAMREILAGMSEEGNRTALRLKGREIFLNDTYWPLSVDRGVQPKLELEQMSPGYGTEQLDRLGMLRERVPHGNPIVLRNAFDVFAEHVTKMADFTHQSLPTLDALAVLNDPATSDALIRRLGKRFPARIRETLARTVHLQTHSDKWRYLGRVGAGIERRAAAAILGFRLTSIANNLVGGSILMMNELGKLSPTYAAQYAAYTQPATFWAERGRRIKAKLLTSGYLYNRWVMEPTRVYANLPTDEESVSGRFAKQRLRLRALTNFALHGMAAAEMMNAAQAYAVLTRNGWSEADAVRQVEIMTRRTQNPSTAIEESGFYTTVKEHGGVGLVFPFFGQPTVASNVLLRDAYQLAHAMKTGRGRKEAAIRTLGSMAALGANSLFSGGLTMLVTAAGYGLLSGGGGDDEEERVVRYGLARMIGDSLDTLVPGGGYLLADPLAEAMASVVRGDDLGATKLLKSIYMGPTKQVSENMLVGMAKKPISGAKKIVDGWQDEDYSKLLRGVYDLVDAVGMAFGVPVGGITQAAKSAQGVLTKGE